MNELIEKAKEIIDRRYKLGEHTVGAAVKTKMGKVYTGVSINSQKVDICSEWCAIGTAVAQGDGDIKMVVAVKRNEDGSHEIYPPCALCRELFVTYWPEAQVIVSESEAVSANTLLPRAWKRKK